MIKAVLQPSAQDIKKLKKELENVEPGLRSKFVQRIKKIGKETESPIKSAIRSVKPLSGMLTHYGVTSWTNGKKAPDSTTVRSKLSTGGKKLTTSLLSVRINSAAVSIVDMAGRSGRSVGKGKRNSGLTPVIRRTADGSLIAYARRTTVEAGRTFIANLNAAAGILKRSASRIAWPSVEKNLPQIEKSVDDVVQEFYREANRKFD